MDELTAICRKEDIAALIIIHEPGFSEFESILNPSYSCLIQDGNAVRARAKAEDFGGDIDKRDEAVYQTSHFVHMFTKTLQLQFQTFNHMNAMFEKTTGYKHDELRVTKGK